MKPRSHLDDLFLDELRGLHQTERQVIRALPFLAWTATHPDLLAALESAMAQAQLHLARLERIFDTFGASANGGNCPIVTGLIAAAREWISQDSNPVFHDAGLIVEAQRLEHYQLAAYACAKTHARLLGHDEASLLLEASLHDEALANVRLTELGQRLHTAGQRFPGCW